MTEATLTIKQETFCQKYIENGGNASEAYRAAYDAENMANKTIWEAASRLLADSKVSARVNELKEIHLRKHKVNVARVLEEYSRLAFLDIRKAFDEEGRLKPIQELDDDTAAAIAGLEVETLFEGKGGDREVVGRLSKIKLSDKKGALDSLAKHLGMFIDRHEHSGKDGGAIITEDRTPLETARRIAFLLSQASQKQPE